MTKEKKSLGIGRTSGRIGEGKENKKLEDLIRDRDQNRNTKSIRKKVVSQNGVGNKLELIRREERIRKEGEMMGIEEEEGEMQKKERTPMTKGKTNLNEKEETKEIGGEILKNPKLPNQNEVKNMVRNLSYMFKDMNRDDAISLLGATNVYYDIA